MHHRAPAVKIGFLKHRSTSWRYQIKSHFRLKMTPEFLARKWSKLVECQTGRVTADIREHAVKHIISRHGNRRNARKQMRRRGRMRTYFRSKQLMKRAIGIALSKPSKVTVTESSCQTSEADHPRTILVKKFKSVIGYNEPVSEGNRLRSACRYCLVVMQEAHLVTAYPMTGRYAHSRHPSLMSRPTLNSTAGTISLGDDDSMVEETSGLNLTMDETLSLGVMDDSDVACWDELNATLEPQIATVEAYDEMIRPGSPNLPQASQSSWDTNQEGGGDRSGRGRGGDRALPSVASFTNEKGFGGGKEDLWGNEGDTGKMFGRPSMKRKSDVPCLRGRAGMPGERGPIASRGSPGDDSIMGLKARRVCPMKDAKANLKVSPVRLDHPAERGLPATPPLTGNPETEDQWAPSGMTDNRVRLEPTENGEHNVSEWVVLEEVESESPELQVSRALPATTDREVV